MGEVESRRGWLATSTVAFVTLSWVTDNPVAFFAGIAALMSTCGFLWTFPVVQRLFARAGPNLSEVPKPIVPGAIAESSQISVGPPTAPKVDYDLLLVRLKDLYKEGARLLAEIEAEPVNGAPRFSDIDSWKRSVKIALRGSYYAVVGMSMDIPVGPPRPADTASSVPREDLRAMRHVLEMVGGTVEALESDNPPHPMN